MTPSHLALAALAKALGAAPERLPMTEADRTLLGEALASPLLGRAASLVLPGRANSQATADKAAVRLFSELAAKPGTALPRRYSLPLGALTIGLTAGTEATPDVQSAARLSDDLDRLTREDRPQLLAREAADVLLGLLQRHAWSAPNGTGFYPEVPLADYARQHAALAACLGSADLVSEAPFALIGTDLSGIQAFIYDIASRKAARALKGRSFYLHLLADNFVAALLDELQLTRAHVVYASGGSAYVLAPNTAGLKEKLDRLRRHLSDRLFTEAGTRLFLAMDFVPLGEEGLHNDGLRTAWSALSRKLSKQKLRRFADKLIAEPATFFTPKEQGGEAEQDAVTGDELREEDRDPTTKKWPTFNADADEEPGAGRYMSRFTAQHIKLGSSLARAEGIDTGKDTSEKPVKLDVYEPGNLPYWNVLPDKPAHLTDRPAYARAPGIRADLFNEPDFLSRPGATGFQLYGGNQYPPDQQEPNAPATYDQLAGTGSFRRLGVLRMDVDSLGKQFIQGFKDNTRSLAHYVTLSRSLDWFFKGYLNTLWKSRPEFRNSLSIVYAGGDDLFVVGRWDVTIAFADAIQSDFRRYTGGALTISGGVAIVPPRFPISRAARLAEDEEKRAKSHEVKEKGASKNAFAFLGTAVHWQHEWPVVLELHTRLVDLLGTGQLPRSILRRIYEFAEQDRTGSLKWRWQMAYDFGRLRERLKGRPDAQAWLAELERAAITNEYPLAGQPTKHTRFLNLLTLAARWAELALRTGEHD